MSRLAATPRLEAEALAGGLDGVLLDARRLAASAPGFHGRRRAGQGEAFWQYREHRPEDGARAVDWRRSGRGERLYVREQEREAAQTAWFWVAQGPGMEWRSEGRWPTKLHRAMSLCLALAILALRGGERVGAIGAPASHRSAIALEELALELAQAPGEPVRRGSGGVVILVSDFFEPLDVWERRLRGLQPGPQGGLLLMVHDPAEEDFPFEGRMLLQEPGSRRETLLGKAEAAKARYLGRLREHRAGLEALARRFGLFLLPHRTDQAAGPALAAALARLAPAV